MGVDSWRAHPLHGSTRCWPETNCYVDLWIEVLNACGAEPRACLGFTVEQDFEGDQFTFFKYPAADLRALFGLALHELAIFDRVEDHVSLQLQRGNLVLVEMDSFYLPDTRGTSYRQEHVKTTIGVTRLDEDTKRLEYFHNGGYYELSGEDFDGVFRRLPGFAGNADLLPPYAEFVKREGPMLHGQALLEKALELLHGHLLRRPANPVSKYREALPQHVETLISRPMAYFHLYAFNVLRQFGANFELLGAHCDWLAAEGETGLEGVTSACERMANSAKALQFQLARAVSRKKAGDFAQPIDEMERAHDEAMSILAARYG